MRISFREFSLGITPEVGYLDEDALNLEFNADLKNKMEKQLLSFNQPIVTQACPNTQSLRGFRPINKEESPVKQEFRKALINIKNAHKGQEQEPPMKVKPLNY
jgi:hypothetical protein